MYDEKIAQGRIKEIKIYRKYGKHPEYNSAEKFLLQLYKQ